MIFVKVNLQDQKTESHILFPFQNVAFQDNNSFNIINERKLNLFSFFFYILSKLVKTSIFFVSANVRMTKLHQRVNGSTKVEKGI